MTDKHTPGPWKLLSKFGDFEIVASDGESLMGGETYCPWAPENPYDWHLIAAAPELLEALVDMVEAVEYVMGLGVPNKETAEARAAIAKAQGESK
jgi:hypothetical protein